MYARTPLAVMLTDKCPTTRVTDPDQEQLVEN